MSETNNCEYEQSLLDDQAGRFIATFLDLRKVLGAGFKHAHQQGFGTTQFMVLGLIQSAPETEPATISSIAGKVGIDPATVVRTVDSLEKRGLVERRRDKHDRRQVFVVLTDAGRAARTEAHQQFIARIRAIFQAMSAEGRTALLNGLEEFTQVGQEVQEAPIEQERQTEKLTLNS